MNTLNTLNQGNGFQYKTKILVVKIQILIWLKCWSIKWHLLTYTHENMWLNIFSLLLFSISIKRIYLNGITIDVEDQRFQKMWAEIWRRLTDTAIRGTIVELIRTEEHGKSLSAYWHRLHRLCNLKWFLARMKYFQIVSKQPPHLYFYLISVQISLTSLKSNFTVLFCLGKNPLQYTMNEVYKMNVYFCENLIIVSVAPIHVVMHLLRIC